MKISVPFVIDVSPRFESLIERLIAALVSSAGGSPIPVTTHVAPCAPAGETGQSPQVDEAAVPVAPAPVQVDAEVSPPRVSMEGEHLATLPDRQPSIAVTAPPPAGNGGGRRIMYWSAERTALLREGWPKGTSTRDLGRAINALPGATVPLRRIAIRASEIGLRRPDGFTGTWSRQPKIEVPAPPPYAPPPVPPSPPSPPSSPPVPKPNPAVALPVIDGVQEAGAEAIRQWAGERGLPFDRLEDLDRVNAKRRQFGLKPFALSFIPKVWR